MATVAGSVATVAKPMGETQKRTKIQGLEPAEKVMTGKAKKKGPYANSLSEAKIKQIIKDLRELNENDFKNKYGQLKELVEADLSRRGVLKGLEAAALGAASMKAKANQEQDLGNGFVLQTIEVAGHTVKSVYDTSTKTNYTLNRKEGGGSIIRNMAPYIVIRNGKVNMAMNVGPDTAEAMRKAGLIESVNEAELSEDDVIVVPGHGRKFKTGFVPRGQSRVDHEVEMARSDVLATMKNAKAIYQLLKHKSEEEGIEGWVQEKLIKANDYLNAVKEYYDEKMMQEMSGGVIAAGGVGESVVNKKFKSKQQAKLMYATAGGADTGVSRKVAKEFIKKSHGQKVSKLPKKVEKK